MHQIKPLLAKTDFIPHPRYLTKPENNKKIFIFEMKVEASGKAE